MKRIRDIFGVVLAVTACAGPPAGGQLGPTADDPLARIHLYEVASEQVAQAQEAGFIEVTGSGVVSVAPDRAIPHSHDGPEQRAGGRPGGPR